MFCLTVTMRLFCNDLLIPLPIYHHPLFFGSLCDALFGAYLLLSDNLQQFNKQKTKWRQYIRKFA